MPDVCVAMVSSVVTPDGRRRRHETKEITGGNVNLLNLSHPIIIPINSSVMEHAGGLKCFRICINIYRVKREPELRPDPARRTPTTR